MPPKAKQHQTEITKEQFAQGNWRPTEAAVYFFILARELEGNPGVTQAELVDFVGISQRSVVSAVGRLLKGGAIS